MASEKVFTIADRRVRLATVFVVIASVLALAVLTYFFDWRRQIDFDLRYYEISCTHEGINPFKVWDRQVETERFVGYDRPDRPDIPKNDNQHDVHAYPAWHTTFFYWYAWVPHDLMSGIVRTANITMYLVIMLFLFRKCKDLSEWKKFFIVTLLCSHYFYDAFQVTVVGNYGILIAILLIAFYRTLDLGHDKTAGVIWAAAMIKPQVALLLFWPLLIQKKYKVIIIAVLTCLVATLWPAYLYGTSPIDLILEIPKLGAPYVGQYSPPALTLFEYLFGSNGAYVLAVFCFCVCGVLCYMVRHCSDWWMKAVPATAMIPYWTYTQQMDQIAAWNVVLFVLLFAVGSYRRRFSWKSSCITFITCVLLAVLQLAFVLIRIIQLSRLGDESSELCIISAANLQLVHNAVEDSIVILQLILYVSAVTAAIRISFSNMNEKGEKDA